MHGGRVKIVVPTQDHLLVSRLFRVLTQIRVRFVRNCVKPSGTRHKIQANGAVFVVFVRVNFLVKLNKRETELDDIMLGVVLWSDAADRKAVIWCEDQGDLAYVNAPQEVLDTEDFFDAGDLVQFDMETTQAMRYANNTRLVIEKAGPCLADVLIDRAADASGQDQTAEIIHLNARRAPIEVRAD